MSSSGRNELVKIDEKVGSFSSPALVFNSIPQNFRALFVEGTLRSAIGAIVGNYVLYVNGDGGGNYCSQKTDAQAAGITAAEGITTAGLAMGYVAGNSGVTAGLASSMKLDIPEYTNNKFKTFHWENFGLYGTALTSQMILTVAGGVWKNTAAITSLDFRTSTGTDNWTPESRLTLWGLPA
jgi:hypothetical protein